MNKFLVSMVASACLVGACSAAVAGNTGMYVLGGFGASVGGDDFSARSALGKRTDGYDLRLRELTLMHAIKVMKVLTQTI